MGYDVEYAIFRIWKARIIVTLSHPSRVLIESPAIVPSSQGYARDMANYLQDLGLRDC